MTHNNSRGTAMRQNSRNNMRRTVPGHHTSRPTERSSQRAQSTTVEKRGSGHPYLWRSTFVTDAGHPDRRVYMKPSVFEKAEKKANRQRDLKNERSLKCYMEETSTSHAPSNAKKKEWNEDGWEFDFDDYIDWYDFSDCDDYHFDDWE